MEPQEHAIVNYLVPGDAKPAIEVAEYGGARRINLAYRGYRQQIGNARQLAEAPLLDRNGFSLQRENVPVVDFTDQDSIRTRYYPFIESVMKRETGASEVLIFDHTLRRELEDGRHRAPVLHVHNDYTDKSARQRVIDLVGREEGERLLQGRFQQINAWKSINGTVTSLPLALLDGQSLSEKDLVATDLIYADRRGEIFEVTHDPAHRWLYYPEMDEEEVLLIRGYDSARRDPGRVTPHTAVELETRPDSFNPRESIEVRALVFHN